MHYGHSSSVVETDVDSFENALLLFCSLRQEKTKNPLALFYNSAVCMCERGEKEKKKGFMSVCLPSSP